MYAKRLPNGNLMVPMRAESEDGKVIGDAWTEISPDHPDFAKWLKDAERGEALGYHPAPATPAAPTS